MKNLLSSSTDNGKSLRSGLRAKVGGLVLALAAALTLPAMAAELDSIHFLIPGGTGGGWDGTARGTGEALTTSGLVGKVSYDNMSGNIGGKAIGYLIENAPSNAGTLMVNSTPFIMNSLKGTFPYSFRDLTPIAGIIGDYGAIVVAKNSPLTNIADLLATYRADPSALIIGGGDGGEDHLVAAMALDAGGLDATKMTYTPYGAGESMAALLSGDIAALATSFSEAVPLAEAGQVRIIGMTASERNAAFPAAPTLVEQGLDALFVNWRGFFAAPGLPEDKVDAYRAVIREMYDTPEWEAVRARNGWTNIHNSGADFVTFLTAQEQSLRTLMEKLDLL